MLQFSLKCINESSLSGSFMLFQNPPPSSGPDVLSLGWMVQPAPPHSQVALQWTLDYLFYWSQGGEIRPGIIVVPAQIQNGDPNGANAIELDNSGFGLPDSSGSPGALTIRQSASLQPGRYGIGIGMSGAATLVVAAKPAMSTVFQTVPNYRIAFGNYRMGQAIDPRNMPGAADVPYGGVTARTVTLRPDGSFTIS